MTGQVKEDILARFGELGVGVVDGKLQFKPAILQRKEFLTEPKVVKFIQTDGSTKTLNLEKDSLAFSYCQVPIVYKISTSNLIELHYADGKKESIESNEIDFLTSERITQRTGEISNITVFIKSNQLQ
jgi:hypothetical protein